MKKHNLVALLQVVFSKVFLSTFVVSQRFFSGLDMFRIKYFNQTLACKQKIESVAD